MGVTLNGEAGSHKNIMNVHQPYQNRLHLEKSPYLLQHANNPVDWFPWGDEAFAKAVAEDKPIFLSIGYSTCHWCHVMAHESFENEAIAAQINTYFVPIKVDREERPDIDNIYMRAVTAMTGQGGWPLTVILTPDKKPFFGGTYFPPQGKWGRPGLSEVLDSIVNTWQHEREKIMTSSASITASLQERALKEGTPGQLTSVVLAKTFRNFQQNYDTSYGGFGTQPKFPTSHNLSFLLRYWRRSKDSQALSMVTQTLKAMAQGGMVDHLGGGFHRYATDQQWQIPHFEKMLYDQAILARTYLEAYQVTHDVFYARVAQEIFDYVLRDMRDAAGGFYSAEDADSLDPDEYTEKSFDPHHSHEKKEGAFYLWRVDEITSLLEKPDAEIFNYYYGIQPEGNVYQDPHGEFTGKNIIFVAHDLEETAQHFNQELLSIETILARCREKLLKARGKRPRSGLDDKILTDWNGLMMGALAVGGQILKEERYIKAAQQAADFVLGQMVTSDGRLWHRYRDGEASIQATLEDYAFLIQGLLDVYEGTFDVMYLEKAIVFAEQMLIHFEDKEKGGFFFTAHDAEALLFRQKDIYDGAIPSGNSVAAMDLVRLAHLTLQPQWEKALEQLFQTFAHDINTHPQGYAQMLMAYDYMVGPSQEIVVAQGLQGESLEQYVETLAEYFMPNKVVIVRRIASKEQKALFKIVPFVEKQYAINDHTTVYVCTNHVCQFPITTIEAFKQTLTQKDGPL